MITCDNSLCLANLYPPLPPPGHLAPHCSWSSTCWLLVLAGGKYRQYCRDPPLDQCHCRGSGHNNTKSVGLAQLLLTLEHLCGASSHYIHCLLSTLYTPVEETFHPALICSWCWQGRQGNSCLLSRSAVCSWLITVVPLSCGVQQVVI